MEIERLPLGQSQADKHRAAELKWRGKPSESALDRDSIYGEAEGWEHSAQADGR